MSWDLYLKPASGSAETFIGALRHSLRQIPAFHSETEAQFDYLNDDTGVYFGIDLTPDGDIEEEGLAVLTINFARPSPFGREAAQILARIARNLPLLVLDHQDDGTWQPFDERSMAESFRHSNIRATRTLKRSLKSDGVHDALGTPVPTALLDYAWEWNAARAARDEQRQRDGRNLWVPKYEFVEIGGRVYSFVLWFDGVATLFPKTELVGLSRNKYQLRTAGLFGRKRPSLDFVPRATIDPILAETYQPDPMVPDALSPIIDGGVAGQDLFLARKLGQDAVTDTTYLDSDDYKRRDPKPFHRKTFDSLIDAEAITD